MFSRIFEDSNMPLQAIDQLSDDEAKPRVEPTPKPKPAVKPSVKSSAKASAKSSMKRPAASPKELKSTAADAGAVAASEADDADKGAGPENPDDKSEKPTKARKVTKRPAAAAKYHCVKYKYHKEEKYGVKVNGKEYATAGLTVCCEISSALQLTTCAVSRIICLLLQQVKPHELLTEDDQIDIADRN